MKTNNSLLPFGQATLTTQTRTNTTTNTSLMCSFAVFFSLFLGYGNLNAQNINSVSPTVFGNAVAMAIDASGNIYIAQGQSNSGIRKITASTGVVTVLAGTGTSGYNGDGIAANTAQVSNPAGIAVAANGDVYFSDGSNFRIRKITASTGMISTICGTGIDSNTGDGASAIAATIGSAYGIALDANDNIYITTVRSGTGARVRKITASTGDINTIAGNGTIISSGDGGLATLAGLQGAFEVTLDASGNVYIAEDGGARIRKIMVSTGIISTVAGTGVGGFSGDGGLATSAQITGAVGGLCINAAGDIFMAERNGNRVRKVTASTGFISTLAGDGTFNSTGDGGLATAAQVYQPHDVYFDPLGRLNIVELGSGRVRVICPAISISPASFPNGAIGTAYSQTLTQTGLLGTPTWSISAGALPGGVTLASATGVISGTPAAIGTFNFTISVTDGRCPQTKVYSIVVACPTITFGVITAPAGVIGTAYSLNAAASSAVSYTVSPALPTGITLNATSGLISGTTTAVTASTTYTVTAVQSVVACNATQTYTFAVTCPTLVFGVTTANDATVGTIYSLNAEVTGNTAIVIYSISPSLPAGLSFNTIGTGAISGTPTTVTASAVYTVTATQNTCSVTQAYTFGVVPSPCSPVILGLASIPNATIGTPYSQTFTATGGTTGATYTFTTTSPQLTVLAGNGLTLSAAGVLTGTPTFSTSITFRVTATTTPNSCPGFKDYTFVINPSSVTSVDNPLTNLVKVSPNPSNGDFNVDFGTINMAKSSVSVYDVQGKVVYSSENNSNLRTISLDKFANGIYLLEVKTENGRITKRLSKTN